MNETSDPEAKRQAEFQAKLMTLAADGLHAALAEHFPDRGQLTPPQMAMMVSNTCSSLLWVATVFVGGIASLGLTSGRENEIVRELTVQLLQRLHAEAKKGIKPESN